MSSKAKQVGFWLFAAVTLLVSLVVFILVIVFGVVGIIRADDLNNCRSSNTSTFCENEVSLIGVNDPPPDYTYWLAGSTGTSVVWALLNTVAVWVFIAALRRSQDNHQDNLSDTQAIELRQFGEDQPDTPHNDIMIDTVEGYEYKPLQHPALRSFTLPSLIALFFGSLSFILAVVCLMWSVAISFNHARRELKTVDPFITVEILAALVLPILLFISTALTAVVLNFITEGRLDAHKGLNRFLPGLKYITAAKRNYWAIEDTFYFALKKRDKDLSKHSCFYSFDLSFSTWVLAAIVAISIQLSFSYFVDVTLDQQLTVASCDDSRLDEAFDCFTAGDLSPVRCRITESGVILECFDGSFGEYFRCNVSAIHCFKFLEFGVDRDLISALAESFALYLVSVHLFARIFSLVKVLLHIKLTKYWGILFTLLGILVFIGAVIAAVFWIVGYAAASVGEVIHFNIINISQFIMFGVYLILVGLLLTFGKWWERIDQKKPTKTTLHLLRPTDADRSGTEEAADGTEEKKND